MEFKVNLGYIAMYCQKERKKTVAGLGALWHSVKVYVQSKHIGERGKAEG